jgi:hypothetical protein
VYRLNSWWSRIRYSRTRCSSKGSDADSTSCWQSRFASVALGVRTLFDRCTALFSAAELPGVAARALNLA